MMENEPSIPGRLPAGHRCPVSVVLISSVPPEPTSAGSILLFRHLVNRPEIRLVFYGTEHGGRSLWNLLRRLAARLARRGRLRESLWMLMDGRWLDAALPQPPPDCEDTIVLTVAHGDACSAALRYAQKHRLPLVTIFHDWWPAIADLRGSLREKAEKRFQALHDASDLAFCVSPGMHARLGSGSNAEVLLPIPSDRPALPQRPAAQPFRLLFFGNFGPYGTAIREALRVLESSKIRMEARGKPSGWESDFETRMRRTGQLLDFADHPELERWIESAGAILIPVSFDPRHRLEMETNFPSKLPESCRFGKPLVIWGPSGSSAVRWANEESRQKAMLVTDPDPTVLRSAMEAFAACPEEQSRLAQAALDAATNEFNPQSIQNNFVAGIRRVAGTERRNRIRHSSL